MAHRPAERAAPLPAAALLAALAAAPMAASSDWRERACRGSDGDSPFWREELPKDSSFSSGV